MVIQTEPIWQLHRKQLTQAGNQNPLSHTRRVQFLWVYRRGVVAFRFQSRLILTVRDMGRSCAASSQGPAVGSLRIPPSCFLKTSSSQTNEKYPPEHSTRPGLRSVFCPSRDPHAPVYCRPLATRVHVISRVFGS